ncbi:hypothetical protein ABPG77_002979 [Micractinium sp. CCAP 211/92]
MTYDSVAEERKALLEELNSDVEAADAGCACRRDDGADTPPKLPSLLQEALLQARLSAPLGTGLMANYMLSAVSLAFVGHLGSNYLAAAALATTLYSAVAKIMLAGMLGALDTYASQAVGARNYEALGSMFNQAVLFLLLHTIPIAAGFACLPSLLRRLGQPEELTSLLGPYLMALLPGVWVDAFFRPFNRILVAQHVALPQMWISSAVAVQHVGATWLFIHPLRMGYVGAAWSTVWSSFLATALIAAYVRASGLHRRVWHSPNGVVFQPWGPYIKLSYSACAMRAIESWSLSICGVAAGWLPNPSAALSAMAVAFSIYGTINMIYGSMLMAACTRVGNGLGAGSAALAKRAALAAAITVPSFWSVFALVLTVPASQRAVIGLFTNESDGELLGKMQHLLRLLAVMLLFDMSQGVMSGVACGAGKQTKGFSINALAHWGFGLPAALLLGFHFKLGAEGMYSGLILGPFVQWMCYTRLVYRMDWDREAEVAHAKMLAIAASTAGAGI